MNLSSQRQGAVARDQGPSHSDKGSITILMYDVIFAATGGPSHATRGPSHSDKGSVTNLMNEFIITAPGGLSRASADGPRKISDPPSACVSLHFFSSNTKITKITTVIAAVLRLQQFNNYAHGHGQGQNQSETLPCHDMSFLNGHL